MDFGPKPSKQSTGPRAYHSCRHPRGGTAVCTCTFTFLFAYLTCKAGLHLSRLPFHRGRGRNTHGRRPHVLARPASYRPSVAAPHIRGKFASKEDPKIHKEDRQKSTKRIKKDREKERPKIHEKDPL